ncbi:unnamed protein product [Durusdinium trenchii]|uniref:Uncharacterized protein n=1 Tax=Durusdinium trenchii TaxID=1381693 RepID=A0ABP0MNR9_9DINO
MRTPGACDLPNRWPKDSVLAACVRTKNPFSILLVVKPVGTHGPELAKALEPHAARLSRRLKVSFFAKTPATQQLCDIYGVRTSDEFLLIEAPQEMSLKKLGHSHVPRSPKYRVENVTAGDVDRFFYDYESGLLPRYLMSYKETKMSNLEGLRELTGEDFIQAVQNPQASVLVEFVRTARLGPNLLLSWPGGGVGRKR